MGDLKAVIVHEAKVLIEPYDSRDKSLRGRIRFWLHSKNIWPCKCGDIHTGDYAIYDWMHHTCSHGGEIWEDEFGKMCAHCGITLE